MVAATTVVKTSTTAGDNPLKSDPELVSLLKRLDSITKYKYFHRWKKSFLDRLLPQIMVENKRGMAVADQASEDFEQVLAKTAKQAHKVVDHTGSSSVKAALALRELGTLLQQTTDTLTEWIPSTSQDEKRQGYTKFHLGAALIQQGFPQYITLKGMEDALTRIETDVLPNATDRQLLSVFAAYHTQVQRFCDVMADLGMYEIMKKCLQFAVAPEIEESSDEEAMEITVEGETMNGTHHSISLEVEPSETVDSLKTTIEQEFGIPPAQLVIQHHGQEIQDWGKTLGKAGVQDGATLHVQLRQIPLSVFKYGSDQAIPVQVTCRNTLEDIKAKVAPASGIAVADQRLFRKSNPMDELSDNKKTVQAYGFVDNEHLYLEPKSITLHVKVPDTNESFNIKLGLDDTTDDIRAKIADQMGLDVQRFTTLNAKTGNELPSQKTARDMVLQDGDVLTVNLNKIPITVKRKADSTPVAELMVHPTKDTLGSIKEQIHVAAGVEPAQQILHHGSDRLEDDSETVQAMGLQPNSILFLDLGPVEIKSEGEIYVAFTVKVQEAPNERECTELAKVTKDFYGRLLKLRYPSTFLSIDVKCHKCLFQADKPSEKYNVYVEWDFTASFDASSSSDAGVDIPTRHDLCSFLAKADLSPYLTKVSKMPNKCFSKTYGVYTEQVFSW